jgi:hypothetical protein
MVAGVACLTSSKRRHYRVPPSRRVSNMDTARYPEGGISLSPCSGMSRCNISYGLFMLFAVYTEYMPCALYIFVVNLQGHVFGAVVRLFIISINIAICLIAITVIAASLSLAARCRLYRLIVRFSVSEFVTMMTSK